LDADRPERLDERADEEVVVFEEPERAEICRQARGENDPLLPLCLCLGDAEPHEVIDERRREQEPEEAPIPPAVEHIARHQNQQILRTPRRLEPPIKEQHQRQKERVFRRVE
jgi:hypothetical protein